VDFRERLIRTDMDRRLLERTVELARRTELSTGRSCRRISACNRFQSAGRRGPRRDTINLLGHAARKVVLCVADLLGWTAESSGREAGIPALLEASVKRALDTEWSDPNAKDEALNTLVRQLDSLDAWLRQGCPRNAKAAAEGTPRNTGSDSHQES